VASFLIEVQVEQPQVLLPISVTADNRNERFGLATNRVKTVTETAHAFSTILPHRQFNLIKMEKFRV
jgi:hypothetical protein